MSNAAAGGPGLGADPATLASALVAALAARQETLATCESLTGGQVAAAIVAVPGASAVFRGGLVTYAVDLKTSLAQVDADFLSAAGPVNHRTAREMAVGAARTCGATWAVSTTGVAGPDPHGGCAVGTFFVGVARVIGPDAEVNSWQFSAGSRAARSEIRKLACDQALRHVLEALEQQVPQ